MCVSSELLIRYGALSQSSNSNKIKLFLEANNLKKGIDFEEEKVLPLRKQGGTTYKFNYFLRPAVFKYCLLY